MGDNLTIAYFIRLLAEKYGDREAIHFKSPFRTFCFKYRDIHKRSLQVANYLYQRDIRKGDRILVWSYNSQEYASILLGCALAGVVVVPIDFNSKADFVDLISKKVQAKCLFHSKRRPFISEDLIHIHVEDFDHELTGVDIKFTDFSVCDDDIYEIVYTSGTTSAPKGVIITNRNIVSNIMHVRKMWEWPNYHMLLSVLPMSHLFEQVAGFFYPLRFGCKIIYLSSRKSSSIIEAFQRERATMMAVVPIFLKTLRENILKQVRTSGREKIFSCMVSFALKLPKKMRRLLFKKVHQKFGGKLEAFIVGGAALDPELEKWWTALGFSIYQGYGLTEASPIVTLNTPFENRPYSVGRSLTDQEIKLGPDNEVWIRGDNITQGYYDNPAENEDRFTDGWYKTGDIGDIDKDGFLYLRGRKKNMIVSSSGLNVYPEDIEAVLCKLEGIRDCCVFGIETNGDVRIHAVLLMNKGSEWNQEQLRSIINAANKKLQSHQQIQDFTIWKQDDFPRTNTLKIKRAPIIKKIKKGDSFINDIKADSGNKLLDMLAELSRMNVELIKDNSNLSTDLGLDSIARVELALLLEEEYNIEVDDSEITGQMTVKELKNIVENLRSKTSICRFPRWAVHWPIRLLRAALQTGVLRIPALFSRTTSKGYENLTGITSPAIFISNHVSHYDTLYILRSLPRRLRKLIIAAGADTLYGVRSDCTKKDKWIKKMNGYIVTLLINTIPFYRGTHVKKSFEYISELMDKGWHILLFPEGQLTKTGEQNQFKSGIGLLAQAMQAPVVPIRLDGLFEITNYERWIPQKFGRVTVTFGQPVKFDKNSDPEEVAVLLEDAVRNLKQYGNRENLGTRTDVTSDM
jgi:long-chain acyl-CoA synthetase